MLLYPFRPAQRMVFQVLRIDYHRYAQLFYFV